MEQFSFRNPPKHSRPSRSGQSIATSKARIEYWIQAGKDALGISGAKHTFGWEFEAVETLIGDEEAFKRRAKMLTAGTYKDGYQKNAGFMPAEGQPKSWQTRVKQDAKQEHFIAKHISELPLEPTDYTANINLIPGMPPAGESPSSHTPTTTAAYLNMEVVLRPMSPLESVEVLPHLGQYIMDTCARTEGAFIDFRSKPTSAALSNGIHTHMGVCVPLKALLNSPKFFDPQKEEPENEERKNRMLERNVRFFRESIAKKGTNASAQERQDTNTCLAIEEACRNSVSTATILKNRRYDGLISRIDVNLFSKRELETDTKKIDEHDLADEASRKLAKIKIPRVIINKEGITEEPRLIDPATDKGCTRVVGPDEISQFGLLFARTMEEFCRDCALVIAPAKESYKRFEPGRETFVSPAFNGCAQRRTHYMGGNLYRGGERISYGEHNSKGTPDTGPLRFELRQSGGEAIGFWNKAYPNQRPMGPELVEGQEAVCAMAMQKYAQWLEGSLSETLHEHDIFSAYDQLRKGWEHLPLRDMAIPPEQHLPRSKADTEKTFLSSKDMAKEIYGDRRKEMVKRRKELDVILEAYSSHPYHPQDSNITRTDLRKTGIEVVNDTPETGTPEADAPTARIRRIRPKPDRGSDERAV